MKKFFAAMALAVALIVCSQASAKTFTFKDNYDLIKIMNYTYADGVVSPNIDFLALRSGPSRNYPELLRIPPGARVRIALGTGSDYIREGYRDYDDNFRSVIYRGVRSFAHSSYIDVIPGSHERG